MKYVLLVTLLLSANVYASQELAQKNGCLACHSIEKKILGPAYKDVSAKYKGDATAQAKLEAKIAKGGSGVWGPMPMPGMGSQVSATDIKALVSWILTQ